MPILEYGWATDYGDGGPGWCPDYGDGFQGWGHPYTISVDTGAGAGKRVSDEGGDLITLMSDWDASGPYKITLRDGDGTVWPQSGRGCWGARPGFGDELYTSRDGKRLRFVVPPLPAGTYDIVVERGGLEIVVDEDAIVVVRRNRYWPIGYAMGRKLPATWPNGARQPEFEEPASDSNRPPYVGWEAVVKAVGRLSTEFGGAPCTRLADDLTNGDEAASLETTLNFGDDLKAVWIDGVRVAVASVDTDLDELVLEAAFAEAVGVSAMTPVLADVRSIDHPHLFAEPLYVEPPMEVGP